MKFRILTLLSFVVVSIFATTTNKVVFVDQNNQINAPEVIASVTDMATNKTEIAIAKAAANAAETAAREGTNLVSATINKIVENEFVVYRHGNTDALGVLVSLPEGTLCRVGDFRPNIATDGQGNAQHELIYYTTEDAGQVTPAIKHANSLTDATFNILDTSIEWAGVSGSFSDADGNHFPYGYSVKFWLPQATQGFFIVYLDADAADGDGMTFNITGGITGGVTEEVTVGTDTLVFRGGLLMEVKSE